MQIGYMYHIGVLLLIIGCFIYTLKIAYHIDMLFLKVDPDNESYKKWADRLKWIACILIIVGAADLVIFIVTALEATS